MILGLDQKTLQTLNQDGSHGEPYVNHLPGRPELFLVIPVREWTISKQFAQLVRQGRISPRITGDAKRLWMSRVAHRDLRRGSSLSLTLRDGCLK
jgi:hypothetical protein